MDEFVKETYIWNVSLDTDILFAQDYLDKLYDEYENKGITFSRVTNG